MADLPSFCLVSCQTKPLAVAVENVAEVLELDSFVRISLCPPAIAGLCPYHGQVVPVAALSGDLAPPTEKVPQSRGSGKAVRESVLILQTEQGLWGLRVDRGGTIVIAARPSRHEPVMDADGSVTVGLIRHAGSDHALLDAAATWRALREMVVHGYVKIRETAGARPAVGRPEVENHPGDRVHQKNVLGLVHDLAATLDHPGGIDRPGRLRRRRSASVCTWLRLRGADWPSARPSGWWPDWRALWRGESSTRRLNALPRLPNNNSLDGLSAMDHGAFDVALQALYTLGDQARNLRNELDRSERTARMFWISIQGTASPSQADSPCGRAGMGLPAVLDQMRADGNRHPS